MVKIVEITNQKPRQREVQIVRMKQPNKPRVRVVQVKSRNSRRRQKRRSRGRVSFKNSGSTLNGYLRSLLDPENEVGCKIPDLVNAPSGTFQLTADGILVVGPGGDGVALQVLPNLNGITNFAGGSNSTPGGGYLYVNSIFVGSTGARALYQETRLVSAVVYAEYIGTTFADSGQLASMQLTKGTSAPTTFLTAAAQPYSKILPVRNGAIIRYKPYDNSDLEFGAVGNLTNTLFFCTAGMAVGASIRFRICANYEGIPLSDTSTFVNAEPSPVSLPSLEQAMNYLGSEGLYSYITPFTNTISPYATGLASAAALTATAGLARMRSLSRNGSLNMAGNRLFPSIRLQEMV
jgi:hypothetical protein